MKIVKAEDVDFVAKPEGTSVHYYTFHDYEVHYNEQAPHTTQTWHHHEKIWESLYIIDGELTAYWREDGTEHSQKVIAGDVIETERTPHTFSNETNDLAKFLVVKRMPSQEDHRETLKTDKILD